MDSATAAVIVLLVCAQDSSTCREVRSVNGFASIEECRDGLKSVLARLQTPQRHVTGHCETVELDLMATGSVVPGQIKPAGRDERGAVLYDSQGRPTANRMVQVTRHDRHKTVTRGYVVPSEQ
ncbi:hypothetical protein KEU06_05630 [Pseudaminobacter sp. 19-2017]|uniref:Uncharacterized protein n=1 Tax=Pseudaminobacter soli (ex Zhang et al. 2022) TaxID=2831468 RepID=A0A942I234_9HYPH|nr:hypothetical protein [Pseudaminobacter soli]MBS3648108.1 hypothetical protein [Pseudaminobacter soli]